jgi:hypothetical protein
VKSNPVCTTLGNSYDNECLQQCRYVEKFVRLITNISYW